MDIMKIFQNYWKSIAVICTILYLSFASPSTFEELPSFKNQDKLAHVLIYFGLAVVLIYEYRQHKKDNIHSLSFVFVCLFFPIILGGIIEILQEYFFSPRTGSWLDWFSNILGVLFGWLLMTLLKKYPHIFLLKKRS
jgi:VanZ family protein